MSESVKMEATADAAVKAMQKLYPGWLADSAWDNTGLLLANTETINPKSRPRVLLANDLSPRVVDEAIYYGVSIIIAYHPFIFRGLKSITLNDPQQVSLIRLAQNNIAVYSPHTALDAAPGGINDWLADGVLQATAAVLQITREMDMDVDTFLDHVGHVTHALKPVKNAQDIIAPADIPRHTGPDGKNIVGYGRFVQLATPVPVHALIRNILKSLGLLNDQSDTASAASTLRQVLVARPRVSHGLGDAVYRSGDDTVKSVAICAGSGADILRGAPADLYLTGEMSHHDALAATVQGKWVVCLLHSNSERLFLKQRLQRQLQRELQMAGSGNSPVEVLVSEADHDPFEIWDMTDANASAAVDKRPQSYSI